MHQQAKGDFLQWLQTFVQVSETGNIHRAAVLRCISPSAASLHIRKLEQDLGFVLFTRKNNGLALTQAGRQYHMATLPILESIERLRTHELLKPTLRGLIRLTTINRLAHHLVDDILQFRGSHPDVSFNVELASAGRVWRNLEEGSSDLAVTIYRRLPGNLQFVALRQSSAFLFTPPGNPFKLSPKPTWDDICGLPFVSLTLEGYVNPVVNVLPDIRRPHNIVIAVDDFLLALQLVKAGIGVCIAPPLTPLESASDYTIFNIDHVFPIGTFGIGFRRDGYLTPQAKAFMNYLVEAYATDPKRAMRVEPDEQSGKSRRRARSLRGPHRSLRLEA